MINKKIFFLTFFAVSLLFISSCSAQIKDLEKFFKDEYPQFNLLHYQKGNFTCLGNQEYVVFFEDQRQIFKDNLPLHGIDKIVVFLIKNNTLFNKYELNNYGSGGYDKYHTKILNKIKINNQGWNGFCFIGDFNNNGLDEIIFFGLSAVNFTINIFEFHNNNFKVVLKYPSFTPLSKIEVKADGKRESFIIYDEGGTKIPDGKRVWYRMKWNEKTNKYEVVEQGIQDWFDPKTGKIINE